MTEKNKEEEPEVIIAKEFLEQHKDMKEGEVHKFVLVCKNCGHKDLLKNFLKRKSLTRGVDIVPGDFVPTPYKPKPSKPNPWDRPYYPKYKWNCVKDNKKIMMAIIMRNEEYEDMFFCPKCGSSLVVLCKEFVKNNIARTFEDDN